MVTDKPRTVQEALEMLRFGVVFTAPLAAEVDRVRTERRMMHCADMLEKHIEMLNQTTITSTVKG